ncbi:MAG: arylsulfatase A-like enzyme [Planctomycetota bacterium]|jgi:arylsulfatase A-like enzyme
MGRTRRDVLKLAGAGMLGSSLLPGYLTASGRAEGADERPNVLFIMTDQHRFDALSCAGNGVVSTPHLDRLAKSGAFFSEMSCTSPVCGPSRASLLSGQFFRGHGCNGSVKQFAQDKRGMKLSVETFDESLHAAGYETEYFGKWHTGGGHQDIYTSGLKTHFLREYEREMTAKHPTPKNYQQKQMEVDNYTGLYFHPYPLNEAMAQSDQRHRGNENQPKIHHDPEAGWSDIPDDDSLTAWLTKRAIGFLETKRDRPFALTLSLLHPHSPLVTNGRYIDYYDPKEMPMPTNVFDDENKGQFGVPSIIKLDGSGMGRFIAQYYALVVEIDDWVGKLLTALDRSGARKNTMIVFTSDHGEMMGSHGQVGKSRCFEESIRVPLFLSLPGRIKPGTRVSAPVSGVDIAPTLLDYCGLESGGTRPFDGVSLRAAIEGESLGRDFSPFELNRVGMRARGMRKSSWKFSISERYGQRLYDLEKDPQELLNLISPGASNRTKHLEVAKNLRGELTEYFGDRGDEQLAELPELR